ncbi:MAG: hypothetical protein U1D55_18005 [Phycisphaerae bacterium]
MTTPTSRIIAFALLLSPLSLAQTRFLVADRTNDGLYFARDLNSNVHIDEPGEISLWFNGANAAGTLGPQNPTALGIRRDGLCIMGDQLNRCVYRLQDLNDDGDAQDAGESLVAADATNASLVSFAFPTGVAFDASGDIYVVNAGTTSGSDAIYRLVDLNSDGDFQDAGEITEYVGVGAFGPGNGPYSPQEILFVGDVGYLRNSSANLFGIYRFVDLNNNGRADDPGEFTLWFDGTNASGVAYSSGFAIDVDPIRPRAIYALALATGGIDQLIRAQDLNNDGDAQDAGEAALIWSTAESGFTSVDVLGMASGQVLVTDNSGKRVIVLTDLDHDGLFTSAGERADYFTNTSLLMGDLRQISTMPCLGDLTSDQHVDEADLGVLLGAWMSSAAGDLDGDGDTDEADLGIILGNWLRVCP